MEKDEKFEMRHFGWIIQKEMSRRDCGNGAGTQRRVWSEGSDWRVIGVQVVINTKEEDEVTRKKGIVVWNKALGNTNI